MDREGWKGTILVVDDSPPSLDVLRDTLEGEGYRVYVATSGKKTIARALQSMPDIILLDVLMPGMDGFETCRRLKADEKTRDIPVIFMTGLTDTVHKVRGFEVGGVDYVTKPIKISELTARVAIHLGMHTMQEQLKTQNERLQQEITERTRAEDEIRTLNTELEQRVEARTAELRKVNEQLKEEVDERKQAEEALRESEERYRVAIEGANDGVAIVKNDVHVYVNKQFLTMFGYNSIDEMAGLPPYFTVHSDDRERIAGYALARLRGENVPGKYEFKGIKKDGTTIYIEVSTNTIIFQGDKAILVYFRDITHEVRLERELRQAQKMEAIGTLAGGIAHDFNNILTVIMGATELALHKLSKENPVWHDLDRVLGAVFRATDLVRQILAFSRQTEQERKPVRIAPIVKEALKLLRSSLPTTIDIRQSITVRPEEGMALADPTQIHQVLMNLCTNAAHAMRAKGGVLDIRLSAVTADNLLISLHPDLKPGPYICLEVSDTGHGMDAAVMERVFDPYFTTKAIGEGTGLGLAVVQGIIKSYGGAITVYSEPGQGTTFHAYLPGIEETITHETEAADILPGGTERILFVDDEKALVELAKEMIEPLGYHVTAKGNSLETLEDFRAAPNDYDLVITDMTMPGLTGKDLARELILIRGDIPIILCTGFSDLANEKQALEAGIRGFIMKPYTIAALAKAIRKALEEK